MSLPTEAIDRLFFRLAATYGAAWDRSHGATPIADVKSVWAHELAGFAPKSNGAGSGLKHIAWALENLPERCPNVIEFRNLCRQSPRDDVPRLEAPRSDPQTIAAELLKLGELRSKVKAPPPAAKDWARSILARQAAGESMKPIQIRFAKEALAVELQAEVAA